jgi:hypothetical protein
VKTRETERSGKTREGEEGRQIREKNRFSHLLDLHHPGTSRTSHPPLSSPPPAHFRTPIADHRDALIDTNARPVAHRRNYPRILKRNVGVSPRNTRTYARTHSLSLSLFSSLFSLPFSHFPFPYLTLFSALFSFPCLSLCLPSIATSMSLMQR